MLKVLLRALAIHRLSSLLPLLFISLWPSFLSAQSIDVQHYHLQLDVDLKKQQLAGTATVRLQLRKPGLRMVQLNLYKLKVEEVKLAGAKLVYQQTEADLQIELPTGLAVDTDHELVIRYGGKPSAPSWFGGFYMTDTLAYNLGVWIDGYPPNFGKVWYPCVDDFTDKATYSYEVSTAPDLMAVANGTYLGSQLLKGKRVHSWRLEQPISTYLASLAVGRYLAVRDTAALQQGPTPIELWIHPWQAEAAKGSFGKLKDCLAYFEKKLGPYRWPRVGYVSVPMQGGAMEHATNIAYPTSMIDGSQLHNTLWAHELSHSWFGNLVTCADAGHMWLNEGLARYCETLYYEAVEGAEAARAYQQKTQATVLNQTHLQDGGYYPLATIPDNLIYSSTVYDKGATVVHALRGHLGDSLFFGGLRYYLDQLAWRNATTDDLQRLLERYTGQPLDDFFRGWVYSGGFAHYYIADTFRTSLGLQVVVQQDLYHKPSPITSTRLPLLLWQANGSSHLHWATMQGTTDTLLLPPITTDVWLDPWQQLPDARMGGLLQLQPGDYMWQDRLMGLSLQKEATVIPILHYGTPPQAPGPAYPRWWQVQARGVEEMDLEFVFLAGLEELTPEQAVDTPTPTLHYRPNSHSPWQPLTEIGPTRKKQIVPHRGKAGHYAVFYTK